MAMLAERIDEEYARRLPQVLQSTDMADLKYRAGWLDAFEFVKGLCGAVESDLYGGPKGKQNQ